MTSSPDPRRRLTSDELIAMFVAFLSIGSIFFWGINQEAGLDLGSRVGSSSPASPPGTRPSVSPSPLASDPGGSLGSDPVGTLLAPRPQAPQSVPQIQATDAPRPNLQGGSMDRQPPSAIVPAPAPTLPNLVPSPTIPPSSGAKAVTGFSDVPRDFWAAAYIGELARRNILGGFQDGTYQPNEPITRAQFASLLDKAFGKPKVRQGLNFQDVSANYWARSAIDNAIQTGFMSGYANGLFRPNQPIPLYQLQVTLAAGLNLKPQAPISQTLAKFEDAVELPKWSQGKVAAAIESGLSTGYPSPQKLTPNRTATRADAAALIYQALVKEGRITSTP